jgi:hypothetical protein
MCGFFCKAHQDPMMKRNPLLAGIVLAGCVPAAHGQDTVQGLRAEIEHVQRTLQALNERLAVLEKNDSQRTASPEREQVVRAHAQQVADTGTGERSPLPMRESVSDPSAAASRYDNAMSPTEPELGGFIPIPGTRTLFRLGGYAKLDAIADARNAGDENQFVTSTIPVGTDRHDTSRFNLHARQTRFSFEARRPTTKGNLRFYLENDFFGSAEGYEFRLRHAYGQLGNTYAGYGYSSFMDADALPDTLDFEGPGGAAYLLVAGVHHSFSLGRGNTLTVAAEDPDGQLTPAHADASISNRFPDVSIAARMERDWGHLQLAALGRGLGYRHDSGKDDVFGAGLSFSGSLSLSGQDLLLFGAVAGSGISRYVADISGSDLDGVVEADGRLQVLGVHGGYVAYTHYWSSLWRSNLVYGDLRLERDPGLSSTAFRRSQYGAFNLIWSPAPSWIMGMELLYGRLQQQDGARADALRLQGSLQYNFIK